MENKLIKIKENINQVIVGKEEVINLLLTALLADGHVLIDDVPGLGKTKLANCLALSLACDFKRVQFTPDLQPADITGIYYYNQKEGDFIFRSGPAFTNVLLADEINRAVPRTQSSLLEVMEEKQVTVEGKNFRLEEPFIVIATQNPVELEGTFPLPEAQLDRFLLKIEIGYPTREEEMNILKRFKFLDPIQGLKPVVNGADILELRERVRKVKITDDLLDYIIRLSEASRKSEKLRLGISPRGSLAIMKASTAYAFIKGREYVLPDDIKYLFPYASKHRLILSDESELKGVSKDEVIGEILTRVEVPVEGEPVEEV